MKKICYKSLYWQQLIIQFKEHTSQEYVTRLWFHNLQAYQVCWILKIEENIIIMCSTPKFQSSPTSLEQKQQGKTIIVLTHCLQCVLHSFIYSFKDVREVKARFILILVFNSCHDSAPSCHCCVRFLTRKFLHFRSKHKINL